MSEGNMRPVDVPVGVGLTTKGNLTGTERRLKDSVADFHNCIVRWGKFNASGAEVLQSISNLVLQQGSKEHGQGMEFEKMASELKGHISELRRTVGKMEALQSKMALVTSQGEALAELDKSISYEGPQIYFHSWSVDTFVDAFKKISAAYEEELKLKNQVISSVAHCKMRHGLLLHVSMWLYDASIPPEVQDLLNAMLYETGHLTC